MTLHISIEYRTNWGEEVVLCLGGKRYPLAYVAEGLWQGEIARFNPENVAEYAYEVVRDGVTVRTEWKKHLLVLPEGVAPKELTIADRWIDRPYDSPFYSSAFTNAIFGRKAEKAKKAPKGANVLLQVAAPALKPNEVLALAGSGKALKNWSKIVPFDGSKFPVWTLALNVTEPFEYKILVADKETLAPVAWEDSSNRWFTELPEADGFMVKADLQVRFSGRNWKGAGTAIPVFALRSADDFGVGEFYDLKKMVDWAASTGQSILQLLPINDTTMLHTWEDSYPYNPNSTFALHPQFLHLPAVGVKEDEEYKALQAELNALDQIDYERVNSVKLELLRKAYAKTFKRLSAKKEYQQFVEKNSHWLLPYAAFCVLRDQNGTPDFTQWKGYAKYNKKKVAAFCEEYKSDIDFWCFVQYHLDLQLSEVCAYAHSKGVVFKGDLPIGISRTSVDAWLYPELFHMDSQAGAPPDAFSADGQNWGFPTYNWEKMAEDGYAWWKSRLAKMSEYFD
ncbi:MAG: 4-alpha-glucanotransferase, partial [Bacteroidales bacterium]|nr:4-alpha-glucanotransferase [Bacteroidales bacterium]